ncbi:MAG: flagellar M-ring protein FliF [candidate division Zixibacteria bacterium]|nr:flagellar M-ring protein FliF [candidate division Zixibacteria bacterium]
MKRWLDAFKAMDANRRFLAVSIVVALVVGTLVVGWWVRSISYGVLYTRLPADEAGEIIDQLEQMKVDYRLSEGGSSIMVPSDDVHELRLRLAAAGLPKGGSVGFEIFDESNLGVTDFLQKVNYRRALEGELAKSVSSLREVSAARVHIVIPENRLFEKDQKPTTASVVLKVNPVGTLDRGKVAGITHLVASAVEGLDPGRVTVLDQNGTLLSSGSDDTVLGGITNKQLDLQKSVETYLQDKAQSLLDGVLGRNRSIVRVNAALNFEQAERTIESFDPNTPVIVSEQTTTERTADNSGNGGGANGGESTVETALTNYELSKTVEHVVTAVGTIDRLSVSVIVDETLQPPAEGAEETETTTVPRSDEELTRIATLVRGAVGIEDDRGDRIDVVSVAFDNTAMEEEQRQLEEFEQRQFYYDIGRKVGYGLLVLLLIFVALRVYKKAGTFIKGLVPPPRPYDDEYETEPNAETEERPVAVPQRRKVRLNEQMAQAAKSHPDEVARVIKTMMAE